MKQAETPRLTQDPHRVFRERVKAGLAQNELAARVGISPAQMCRIESGKSGASVDTLKRLAKAFGCAIADLMPPDPLDQAVPTSAGTEAA